MRTETVTGLDGDGNPISVTIAEATVLIGMRRTRLRVAAGETTETDIDLRILHLMTYPDLIAAVVEQSGLEWPLSFDDFCQLPDKFVSQWEQAVYSLNPHWLPDYGETQEKKQPTS